MTNPSVQGDFFGPLALTLTYPLAFVICHGYTNFSFKFCRFFRPIAYSLFLKNRLFLFM
jgi:hypothetical protein